MKNYDLSKIVEPLLNWYTENKRDLPWRHNPTPYRVWISEIMLQQTRVEPVVPYYLRFLEAVPDVSALAKLPEDQLMKLWEGLGYYSRARNLQKAAKIIDMNGSFPDCFEGWLALPGIGEYTAGAVCSIALGLPTPAVDGNVLRVLSRLMGSFDDIASSGVKKAFTHKLAEIYPKDRTSDFTQCLMELGATVCLPNGEPHCDCCPVSGLCVAKEKGLIDQIPVKVAKKARKIEEMTILILRHGDQIATCKRPNKGLLAGLWELPNINGHLSETEVLNRYSANRVKKLSDSVHVFSHIEWHMIGYELEVAEMDSSYVWNSIVSVLEEQAIPSAFRCYTNYLRNLRYEV